MTGIFANARKEIVLGLFFLALLSSTFFLDLQVLGFEQLQKQQRENFIILLSSTRFLGILVLCGCFHYLKKWTYFICIILVSTMILGLLLMKYTFESSHHLMVSTGNLDMLKFILNKIAAVNDEDALTEKIAFSHTP